MNEVREPSGLLADMFCLEPFHISGSKFVRVLVRVRSEYNYALHACVRRFVQNRFEQRSVFYHLYFLCYTLRVVLF